MSGRTVRLVGGPLDGQLRDLDDQCRLRTEEWAVGTVERDFGSVTARVVRVELATYRRIGDDVFEHCRTPTVANDTDLDFSEQQLRLEDE